MNLHHVCCNECDISIAFPISCQGKFHAASRYLSYLALVGIPLSPVAQLEVRTLSSSSSGADYFNAAEIMAKMPVAEKQTRTESIPNVNDLNVSWLIDCAVNACEAFRKTYGHETMERETSELAIRSLMLALNHGAEFDAALEHARAPSAPEEKWSFDRP